MSQATDEAIDEDPPKPIIVNTPPSGEPHWQGLQSTVILVGGYAVNSLLTSLQSFEGVYRTSTEEDKQRILGQTILSRRSTSLQLLWLTLMGKVLVNSMPFTHSNSRT